MDHVLWEVVRCSYVSAIPYSSLLLARSHRRCQVYVHTSLFPFLPVAVDASPAKVAYEVVGCGLRLGLAQATQDIRNLFQEAYPGIGFDNFLIFIDRNDSSGCVGTAEVGDDVPTDDVDGWLSVQGYGRGCMKGSRIPDLLKSLLVPLRLVPLGVGSDEFTGSIGAVDLETLVR